MRIWFPLAAAGYIWHYFFFDLPNDLQPTHLWLGFRFGMAAIFLTSLAFYWSRFTQSTHYKLPAAACFWLMAFTQAKVTQWYSLDAWLFCFIFVIVASMVLRMSPLISIANASFSLATIAPILISAGLTIEYFTSAGIVTLLLVIIFRSSQLSEIRALILERENAKAQKKIVELNVDFSDRVRAFIPRVIAERIDQRVRQERYGLVQATVDVLRPTEKEVACLFSDIRGFTENSNDLEEFVGASAIPEIRVCSDAIERHRGIPRKIGDLIFAYFDDGPVSYTTMQALAAAMEMARENSDLNQTSSQIDVKRYILVTSGQAIVGNIGGLDSSVEITALGPPVNLLSRIDEITKA